jgi:putative transcriptional regulator
MDEIDNTGSYLPGQLLIAMPTMSDPRFERSVIYMCAHTSEGAMGLVLNRLMGSVTFPDLLEQIGIESENVEDVIRVHFGGPVESGRGFVLHTADYLLDGTLVVDGGIALTASVDILRAIADGGGPRHRLLALGYAGWGPGQLEGEIQANGWLNVPADADLIFDDNLDGKWEASLAKIGIDLTSLSGQAGHA